VQIEFFAIFLLLHVPESTGRPSSPRTAYESIWPNEMTSNPHSPVKERSPSKLPGSSSPKVSPNSPKSRPTSPTRLLSPRQSHKSSSISQQALSIQAKLPLFLRSLAIDGISSDFDSLGTELAMSLDLSHSMPHGVDTRISAQSLESLGLILKAATSEAEQPSSLLSVFTADGMFYEPLAALGGTGSSCAGEDNTMRNSSSMEGLPSLAADYASLQVSSAAVYGWIEAALPNCLQSSSAEELEEGGPVRRYSSLDQPVKLLEQLTSFLLRSSLTLSAISTTFFLLASSGPSHKGASKQAGVFSDLPKSTSGGLSDVTSGGSGAELMSESNADEVETEGEGGMSGVEEACGSTGQRPASVDDESDSRS
jgi:hypothetical protein